MKRATWDVRASTGRAWSFPLHLRMVFPDEVPVLLRAAGLELAERSGDYTRAPFDAMSPRQVCVAGSGR